MDHHTRNRFLDQGDILTLSGHVIQQAVRTTASQSSCWSRKAKIYPHEPFRLPLTPYEFLHLGQAFLCCSAASAPQKHNWLAFPLSFCPATLASPLPKQREFYHAVNSFLPSSYGTDFLAMTLSGEGRVWSSCRSIFCHQFRTNGDFSQSGVFSP